MTVSTPIVLDYNDLIDPTKDLTPEIQQAFGSSPGCLGALFVANVPGFVEKRQRLLTLSQQFAHLSEQEKEACVHLDSTFLFGWSHGKEIMNGKPDTAKGSFYNNPMMNDPECSKEFTASHPEYAYPNVWPKVLPDLEPAFMELGQLIVSVGKQLAVHCDKIVPFLSRAICDKTTKARLLHYFPIKKVDTCIDSWCGLHLDHSLLTGLTSAMFVDENNGQVIGCPDPSAGLYIQSRGDEFVQVNIPSDVIAFQIGEASQVASGGLFKATPHLVKGASVPDVARNTFAVFMQPDVDYLLTKDQTFDQFTKQVMKRHY